MDLKIDETPQTNDLILDCPICLSVLFRPITLHCGHRYLHFLFIIN